MMFWVSPIVVWGDVVLSWFPSSNILHITTCSCACDCNYVYIVYIILYVIVYVYICNVCHYYRTMCMRLCIILWC